MIKRLFIALTSATLFFALASCSTDTNAKVEDKNDKQSSSSETPKDTTNISSGFLAYDTDGNLRDLNEWIGKKPVVINFWGTWCGPCRKEIPELIKIYDEYKSQGVEIISLAVRDTPSKVVSFTTQKNMKWVQLLATRDHLKVNGVSGVPTTFFYNKDGSRAQVRDHNGQFTDRFVGPRPYETFKAAVESIL